MLIPSVPSKSRKPSLRLSGPNAAETGRKAAFTLIEMLVVIAIIALLAALLFPSISKSVERATQVRCLNNLRQIATATLSWATLNEGKLPNSNRGGSLPPHSFMGFDAIFGDLLGDRDSIMFCPGKLMQARNPNSGNGYDTHYGTYQYFSYRIPFLGTYATDKPGMSTATAYPADAALWGCLTVVKGNQHVLSHHQPNVAEPLRGMNAVHLDGHGGWVKPSRLEAFYSAFGDQYYWPIPGMR